IAEDKLEKSVTILTVCTCFSHRNHAPFLNYIIPFIRHTVKGNIGYLAPEFLLLNLSHQSRTFLEACLIRCSHFSDGCLRRTFFANNSSS
ncbi:hypothetical protein, partial [uncultured Ruminococcus sp.]|uniref:hypothetical protein n=1 Tax=uncultured Ruminococcus sp. TaxID=165186 RepID=UPI0025F48D88